MLTTATASSTVHTLAIIATVLFALGLLASRPGVVRGSDPAGNAMVAGCLGLLMLLAALGCGIAAWVYAARHADEVSTTTMWLARAPVLVVVVGAVAAWVFTVTGRDLKKPGPRG